MGIKIEVKKGHVILFFLLMLVSFVIAYGTNNPSQFGNSASEIHVNLSNGSSLTFQEYADKDSSGSSISAGTITYFNLTSCPSGWSELDTLKGRYIVGLPASGSNNGTLGGTVGTVLGDKENREISHTHDCCNANSRAGEGTDPDTEANMHHGGSNKRLGNTTVPIGNIELDPPPGTKAGTTAPYVQLKGCIKN